MAATAQAAAPFAQELQALKTELQRTLARLGGAMPAPAQYVAAPASPWSRASATTSATTATTPTTVRSDATSARSEASASPAHSDATTRILYELVVTARRRRQVEMHMARELERESRLREEDRDAIQWPHERPPTTHDAVDERERAIRGEIEALRLRRKQILLEIDNESKEEKHDDDGQIPSDLHGTGQKAAAAARAHGENVSNLSASIKRQGEHEYSIEGTVKLGNLMSQAPPLRQPSSAIPQHHSLNDSAASRLLSSYAHAYRQPHHDTLQDVFALQLKFAETMLQLEKSIQARDQILVPSALPPSVRTRRRSSLSRRSSAVMPRRCARPPSTIHEERERDPADSSASDADDHNRAARQRRVLSSYDESDVSLSEHTMRLWRRYGLDGTSHRPATRSSPNMAASVATTTTSTSPNSQPSPQAVEQSAAPATDVSPPATASHMEEHLTTPVSTNDSGNKQVRFNDGSTAANDDYPTPLVARNISFDQESIDSSEEEETMAIAAMRRSRMSMTRTTSAPEPPAPQAPRKRATVVSSDDEALSFLEGSSVCSADLNDESFLMAFYALRNELQRERIVPRTPPPPPTKTRPTAAVPETIPEQALKPREEEEATKAAEAVDLGTLQRQKRGLALDIQSLTATLVLAQDAAQREEASAALDRLRRQLRTVEAQEQAASTTA